VEVTQLEITGMQWFSPCQLLACPQVQVQVHVETSDEDQVKLTVVIEGVDGPHTYTRNLSGSTSYDVTVPGSGQDPYLLDEACDRAEPGEVVATASTTPAAPNQDTASLSCSS
jgi:hypothetical protein